MFSILFFYLSLKFFLRGAMTTEPVVLDVFVTLSLCQISETGNIKQERFTVDPSSQGFSSWLAGSIALLRAWGRACGIRTWQRQAVYHHLMSAREKRKRGSEQEGVVNPGMDLCQWAAFCFSSMQAQLTGWWYLPIFKVNPHVSSWVPHASHLWESPQRHAQKRASLISESLKPIKLIIQMKHALHPLCSWIMHWTVTSRPLLPPRCCGRIKCCKTKLCPLFIDQLEANSLSERLSWGQRTFQTWSQVSWDNKSRKTKKDVWDKGKVLSTKLRLGLLPHLLKFRQSENFVTRTRELKRQYATSVWRLLQ